MRDNPPMREIQGLLVDPVDGARPGALAIDGDTIVAAEYGPGYPDAPLVVPGLIDLHVYDTHHTRANGVTGYLATVGTSAPGMVEAFLAALPDEPDCLGAHVEGPYINPEAAGAQAIEHVRPVDVDELEGWLATGRVRLVTLAPEVDGGLDAIARIVAAGAVASIGHTRANYYTTAAAIRTGARFATHVWNAMSGFTARVPGAVGTLLADERVTLGVIADGRHLHPVTEAITLRVAGPARVALTSDLVPPPQEREDGKLLGGDRIGTALLRRVSATHGLAAAAEMASLTPARVLGLADRGRLCPGFRADVAILDESLDPCETIVAGRTVWSR